MTNQSIADMEPTIVDTDLPAMTGAELRATREYLGLSTKWIADHLVIGERRIQRMESGKESIPQVIVDLIERIHAHTAELCEQLSATYRRKVKASGGASVLLPTYRVDRASEVAGLEYPSRWHRHVAARVASSCPGAVLTYIDEQEGSEPIGGRHW